MVDLTSTAGHGLLLEMSIVELRERLELVRQQNDEENRQRHDQIVRAKHQKELELVDKLNYINKYRNEIAANSSGGSSVRKGATSVSASESLRTTVDESAANETIAMLKNRLNELKRERESNNLAKKSTVKSKAAQRAAEMNTYANQRVFIFAILDNFRFV